VLSKKSRAENQNVSECQTTITSGKLWPMTTKIMPDFWQILQNLGQLHWCPRHSKLGDVTLYLFEFMPMFYFTLSLKYSVTVWVQFSFIFISLYLFYYVFYCILFFFYHYWISFIKILQYYSGQTVV